MVELRDPVIRGVRQVIHDCFPGRVQDISIGTGVDADDEETLQIMITIGPNPIPEDFQGRFFGLTGRIRAALGPEMAHYFPVIRFR